MVSSHSFILPTRHVKTGLEDPTWTAFPGMATNYASRKMNTGHMIAFFFLSCYFCFNIAQVWLRSRDAPHARTDTGLLAWCYVRVLFQPGGERYLVTSYYGVFSWRGLYCSVCLPVFGNWILPSGYNWGACGPQLIGTYYSCLHCYCLEDSYNVLPVFSGPQGIEPLWKSGIFYKLLKRLWEPGFT